MSKGRAAGPATRARREEAAAPKIQAGGATWGRVAARRSPRTVTYARIQRAHGGTHPKICMLREMRPRGREEIETHGHTSRDACAQKAPHWSTPRYAHTCPPHTGIRATYHQTRDLCADT